MKHEKGLIHRGNRNAKKLELFSAVSDKSNILSWSEIKKRLKGKSEKELIGLLGECYKHGSDNKIKLSLAVSESKEESSRVFLILKERLHREFWTTERNGAPRTPDMKEARKIVTLAKNSIDDGDLLLDIMLDHFEHGVGFTVKHGDMWDGYYGSVENAFQKTCDFMVSNKDGIDLDRALERIDKAVEDSDMIGWGFHDNLVEMRDELNKRLEE